ncbi:MAG: hypothetical protein HQ477_04025 [Chloroflexi bacterium]|nr:hypothetical protein [Chloroflexota bacterium]
MSPSATSNAVGYLRIGFVRKSVNTGQFCAIFVRLRPRWKASARLNCGGGLGQPPNHTDVTDIIPTIDRRFNGYRDRLASIVATLVMESQKYRQAHESIQAQFRWRFV